MRWSSSADDCIGTAAHLKALLLNYVTAVHRIDEVLIASQEGRMPAGTCAMLLKDWRQQAEVTKKLIALFKQSTLIMDGGYKVLDKKEIHAVLEASF